MFGSDTDGLKPYGAHIDIETRNGKVPLQIFGDGRHLYVSTTRIGHPFNQRIAPANILWDLGDGNVRFDSEAARAELMGGTLRRSNAPTSWKRNGTQPSRKSQSARRLERLH